MPVLDEGAAAEAIPPDPFGLLAEELEELSLAASARASLRIRRQWMLALAPVAGLAAIAAACILSLFAEPA